MTSSRKINILLYEPTWAVTVVILRVMILLCACIDTIENNNTKMIVVCKNYCKFNPFWCK